MLAHKAVHEAHVAAEVIAGELQGIKVKKGLFPWTASGRAIANGRDEGVFKLLFDGSPEAHAAMQDPGHQGSRMTVARMCLQRGSDAMKGMCYLRRH